MDERCLVEEVGLAFLQADRVHDGLALHALEAGLDHRPLRAVDHDRQPRHLRLGRDVVQERRHRGLGVEHPLVHVHVEDVRAAAHLVERHLHGGGEVAALDQPRELRGAGDVGPLADHLEVAVGPDRQRLEAAELRRPREVRHLADGLRPARPRRSPRCDRAWCRSSPRRCSAGRPRRTRGGSRPWPAACSSYSPKAFGRPAFG